MKILMVISQFYPMIGGAEKQAQLLAKTLLQKGIEVKIVTGWWNLKTPRKEIIDGVMVIRNFCGWGMFGLKRYRMIRMVHGLIYMVSLAAYLILHRREYDIIHVHQALYPAFVSVLVGKQVLGKPVIVKTASSGMTSDIKQLEGYPLGNIQLRYLIKKMECLVSNSKVGGDEFKEIGFPDSKIVFISNGVEIPNEKKIFFGKVKLVMAVARLSLEKGIDVLLKAWAVVVGHERTLKLVVIGDGPLKSRLNKLAQSLELDDSVDFLGMTHNVVQHLRSADIFVLPSRTEGLSNALLEAMSHGIPCIATNVGGNSELLGADNGKILSGEYVMARNGLLVNPDDVKGLSEAILYVIRNQETGEEMGRKGRKFLEDNFSIDSVANKYIGLYQHMVEERV
jgi:glycosyltransferase involved in cell wall biosynthesis